MTTLLEQTVDQLLSDHCGPDVVEAAEGTWAGAVWSRLEEAGLVSVGVAEDVGGSGGGLADAATVVRTAAKHAAPVPLAETSMLAGWLCQTTGLQLPEGPATVAVSSPGRPLRARRDGNSWVLEGSAGRVPWGHAGTVVVVAAVSGGRDGVDLAAQVPSAACTIVSGSNVAGEPRDEVDLTGLRVPVGEAREAEAGLADAVWLRGALARTVQIAGALEAALELTLRYAAERPQFGRPIARFQAVQHMIAELAGEVAAVSAAADAAVADLGAGVGGLSVAGAKVRAGRAAGRGSMIAHQVHGAIGVTREHRLHHLTRRLWSWREEFGSDGEWALHIGRVVQDGGHRSLWPSVTGPGTAPHAQKDAHDV